MMDSGFGALHSSGTYVQDVPELPRTLGWDGQRNCSHLEWDAWNMSGMFLGSRDSGMGWKVGLESSGVGHSGYVWDVPGFPTTLGKYGQWVWNPPQQWDTLDMSRMFLSFPGLLDWDGQRNCSHLEWMLETCLGCPWVSWDSGMGWTAGLEPSRVGHVRDVPGLPETLGSDR